MEVFLHSAAFQQQSFQAHTGRAVRCKVPPEQHMILWPVFFSVADFWTLTVGCFYIVRAKKSWKLFRGYSRVRIFTSHSVLHGKDSMASRRKGWLAPTSPLGSPFPPFPTAFLLQRKNIWIWRSGPCNFLYQLLLSSLNWLTARAGAGPNWDQTFTCTHCDPSGPAHFWCWMWEKVQLMVSREERGWDPAVTFPRIH